MNPNVKRVIESYPKEIQDKIVQLRQLIFELDEDVPEQELKTCIALSLNYHALKHQTLLGV